MALTDLLPFRQAQVAVRSNKKKAEVLSLDRQKAFVRLFKVAGLALGFQGSSTGRAAFEDSPYDFDRIIQAVDTDSYVKQGFNKYKELLWKEGWDIVSENPEAVSYLWQRIDFMEIAMRRPFQDLLIEIGDQLAKFSNCFLAKSRGDLGPFFPGKLDAGDKNPIIGYYVVPVETVEVLRDKHNKVLAYRQRVDDSILTQLAGGESVRMPTWRPDEMIHFTIDRKPGHIFGTPFMVSTIDDVVALRQIEEDIQNLVHRELFPLYKYKVGTEEHPAEPEEIDQAAEELANLRTEGGLVLPDRHDVEVIGAEGNAMDASAYLGHFKERVAIGLGLSPHHLGMMMNGGNRSVTDRLDVALYDKIKTYQRYLSAMIRLMIFNEILFEGGFDPIVSPKEAGASDRCDFVFNEIDVDTQVKKETHEMQKFTNNISTLPETRLSIGKDPTADEEDLQLGVQARLTPQQEQNPKISTKKGPTFPEGGGSKALPAKTSGKSGEPVKPDAQKPSSGGARNLPNTRKGGGNVVRPSNQFGRRSSPNIRRSDPETPNLEYIDEILDLLDE